jgi:hypothetical protein
MRYNESVPGIQYQMQEVSSQPGTGIINSHITTDNPRILNRICMRVGLYNLQYSAQVGSWNAFRLCP